MLACWTALAISGLAKAGTTLQTPEYMEAAEAAAAFVRGVMYDEGDEWGAPSCHFVDGAGWSERDRPRTCTHTHTNDAETGRLRRCVFKGELSAVPGLADDYTFLIRALLDLYEATATTSYLAWAQRLQVRREEPTGTHADRRASFLSQRRRGEMIGCSID